MWLYSSKIYLFGEKCVVSILILFFFANFPEVLSSGFHKYPALNAIVFTRIEDPAANTHSEYYFGKCATVYKYLIQKVTLKYEDLKQKLVYRGFLNYRHSNHPNDTTVDIPNCIYINATSQFADTIKYDAFYFNICICRLVVSYAGHKYVYVYFEWYIPVFMRENIVWDLNFYLAYERPEHIYQN